MYGQTVSSQQDHSSQLEQGGAPDDTVRSYIMAIGPRRYELHLTIPDIHCAGCIQKIEGALRYHEGVEFARLNFSTRRLLLRWTGDKIFGRQAIEILHRLGYAPRPYDPQSLIDADKAAQRQLLTAIGVAGFAAGNIMLLSTALWTTDAQTMGGAMRDFMHWVSALIAVPCIAFAGQTFFRSALDALRARRTNMDVPIAVGLILTTGMSLFELLTHGEHAYFDSAIMLLFFLLVGRYLDLRARASARSAARELLSVMTGTVTIIRGKEQRTILARELAPHDIVLCAMGERVAGDSIVIAGHGNIDNSLVTGESLPVSVDVGDTLLAGALNIGGPLTLRTITAPGDSQVAEMVRLIETAEQSQARYIRLADRIARLYTPFVHAMAFLACAGWTLFGHAPWQDALLIATTVLIITCPCALALAVPVVQVLAVGALMKRGIMVRGGDVLEKMAEIDTVIFDKTGTLTAGRPVLCHADAIAPATGAQAAALAQHSRHPLCRALAQAYPAAGSVKDVVEYPGMGLTGTIDGQPARLGHPSWVLGHAVTDAGGMEMAFIIGKQTPVKFAFHDELRADAPDVVAALRVRGLAVMIFSGDNTPAVQSVAAQLGITTFRSQMSPAEKCDALKRLQDQGHRVLMVGDGINDAPVLSAAYASLSPASGMAIACNAAGSVFNGDRLAPVLTILDTAKAAQKLVWQNLAMTALYNMVAIPVAFGGLVTPMIAAIAMSASSLSVTLNAFRLRGIK